MTSTRSWCAPGDPAALAFGIERLLAIPRWRSRLAGAALSGVERFTWSRRAERLEHCRAGRRRPAMISERLLSIVRCPDCRSASPGRRERVDLSGMRPRVPGVRATATSTCGRAVSSRSRRNISTRHCTPTRVTNASRRRCSDRRSATTCSARSWRRSRAIASSISGAAAAGRCSGTATGAPTMVGIDISPFFSEEARRERRPAAR